MADGAAGAAAPAAPAKDAVAAKFGRPMIFGPPPSAGAPEAAVLWLHGFGDKPDGWAQLLFPLRRAAPQKWRWIHLRAPKMAQPCYKGVKLPGWGQFHSSKCLKVGGADYEDEDAAGTYAATILAVHREIGLLEEEGVEPSKIFVAGFSQGAAVAAESVLRYPRRLAGCAALSGWLTPRARAAVAERRHWGMPLLFCHGTRDDMVGVDCSEAALRLFEEAAAAASEAHSATLELFKGMEHTSCPRELRLLAAFLQRALAGGGELQVPEWERGGAAAGSDEEPDGSGSEADGDVVFVVRRRLEALRDAVKAGAAVTAEAVVQLLDFAGLGDDEALLPMDVGVLRLKGVSADDLAASVRRSSPEAVARAFAEAAAAGTDCEELTVGQLRRMSGGSEEGEEEEPRELDEASQGSEADAAPPAKRAR